MVATTGAKRAFELILVKPSHYDDDGYVIQWLRAAIPSNTLAALYGLAADAAERQALGPEVGVRITALDETNTRIVPRRIIRRFRRSGGFGMVGLVGVQSNQFPRALDIARPLRAAGVPVVMGGFHVSGCLAMLPTLPPDLQEALDLGITLFAGEAEGRLDQVLRDAAAGTLKPIYNYMRDLPSIGSTPVPFLPRTRIKRTAGRLTTFDAGRGCPFQCSFCTIINVQGRKSRSRSPEDVERIIRDNWAQGINRFFITDDNFARNDGWEAIFDRIIALREGEGLNIRFTIQVDTLCHKTPGFIEKAGRAGVTRVFIGLENINPDNLLSAKKRQNKITEYRQMLLAWKSARVMTYAGYILGFPNDTPESIRRDIEIIQRELPIDLLEFFCLTPLPGSEDHQTLARKGIWMDPDMNKYDLEHVLTDHPRMSRDEWQAIYWAAWDAYYTPEHMKTVMRRAGACGISVGKILFLLLWFYTGIKLEKVHPLQSGYFRIKARKDRRPGLAIEPLWVFYPRYAWEVVSKNLQTLKLWWRFNKVRRQIKADPERRSWRDQSLTVGEDETEVLELFTHTEAARAAVRHAEMVAGKGDPRRATA